MLSRSRRDWSDCIWDTISPYNRKCIPTRSWSISCVPWLFPYMAKRKSVFVVDVEEQKQESMVVATKDCCCDSRCIWWNKLQRYFRENGYSLPIRYVRRCSQYLAHYMPTSFPELAVASPEDQPRASRIGTEYPFSRKYRWSLFHQMQRESPQQSFVATTIDSCFYSSTSTTNTDFLLAM